MDILQRLQAQLRQAAEVLLRTGVSLDDNRRLVQQALEDKYGVSTDGPYAYNKCPWLREYFADSVVYDYDGAYYQITYAIDRTGEQPQVMLGEPVEVEVAYIQASEEPANWMQRFLEKFREILKGKAADGDISADDLDSAMRQARASIGGIARGEKRKAEREGANTPEPAKATEGSKLNPFKLMSEVVLAEDGKTGEVQIFPSVGKYSHPRYGELNITKDFLSTVKANFDGKIYQQELPLTIDLEHESKLSGAAGWIKDVEIRGDKGMWATIEFNDRGKSLVDDNAYKYFSPEFYDSWQDPSSNETHDNLLIGGALTNRPFFKSMAPVAMLTEHGMMFVEAAEDVDMDNLMAKIRAIMEQLGMSEKDITAACNDMKSKMKKTMPAKGAAEKSGGQASRLSVESRLANDNNGGEPMGLTEEEARTFSEMQASVKQLNERLATAEAKATNEEQARQAAETQAKQAVERVVALERDANRKQLAEFVRGHRLAFQETEIEQSVDKLEKMQAKLGEDFVDYQAEKASLHERIDASLAMSQIGRANGGASTGAQAEFETAKRKTMSENPQLSEAEAITKVASANPGLYKRYDQEFLRMIKRGGE